MDAAQYQKIQAFIDDLSDEEVYQLYRQLAGRVVQIRDYAEKLALNSFRPLERVYFHNNNMHIEGVIIQINRRTVSIITDDGERWTVAPQHLNRAVVTPPPPPKANGKSYIEGTVVSQKRARKKRKKKGK